MNRFVVGVDAFWPKWFAMAVAEGLIRTESGGARKPITAAYVRTEHGIVTARDGDTVQMCDEGIISVVAGKKWRLHI